MVEELTSVYDLPSDEHLVAATQAWLQSSICGVSASSFNVQIPSARLNLRAVVQRADDDPSFALLLPGRRKVKAQQKEALAR